MRSLTAAVVVTMLWGCAGAGGGAAPDAGPCAGQDPVPDLNGDGVADCLQNGLANGQFVKNTAPWLSNEDATIQFNSTDAMGLATSGSASVVTTGVVFTGASVGSPCLKVDPSTRYSIYLQYLMASGQPGGDVNDSVSVHLAVYTDDRCQLLTSALAVGSPGTTKDAWTLFHADYTTAPDTFGVTVHLAINTGFTNSPVGALFDNVMVMRP